MPKGNRKLLIAIYIGVAIYVLPMFPHNSSANELTRWATAASIVEKGSFDISWTETLIGPNVDTAHFGTAVYSNKAPAIALIGVPFYALSRMVVGPPDASNIRVSWFIMRFAVSTLPLLILVLWIYKQGADEFSLAVLLFASPLFVYSLLLFSHVLAAVSVYFAFRLLYDPGDTWRRRFLIAGALSGLAVLSEFPAIFPIAVFAVGILFTDTNERPARLGYFVAGALPLALFLLIYNYSLFGSPLSMSYAHESFPEWAEVANTGAFGIGLPTLSNLFLLLLSPSRGLFFFAPVLALGVFSFFVSEHRASIRHRVKIAAVLLTVVVMSGHGAAQGGWTAGPRYLVLVVPLLMDSFFDRESYPYSNFWQGALFAVSAVLCILPVLTFPFAPPEFLLPHNDFWAPLLFEEGWYVPNLANVLGAPSAAWTVVPVILGVAAATWIVVATALKPRRFCAGLAIGLVLIGLYLAAPLESDEDVFRRATIAERFFRPADRLTKFENRASASRDDAGLRRINDSRWKIADTRAYAPDSFPYQNERTLSPSPTSLLKQAIEFQKRGQVQDAESALLSGKENFPFARCEFSSNLAALYYTSGRKKEALTELEGVQPLVFSWSRDECIWSRELLAELRRESQP